MTYPLKELNYCTRCCMPQTQEGLVYDEMGVCRACISSEQKMHIDWSDREKVLREILEDAKKTAGNNYDCIIPISGGKDSVFQLYVLTEIYKMKPLAVTFSHNWYSEVGWYNLMNCLEQFNVDHIMFTPNRKLVNSCARQSLQSIGDACWHCHAGVGAFPMHIAIKFGIKLLVWGESVAEASGRGSHFEKGTTFDAEYFTKVSAKKTPQEMVGNGLTNKDLFIFNSPTVAECEEAGIYGIHLGDFVFWDDERQTEFIKDHFGWKETEMEGTYKGYKSAECIMPGVHDFTCYLKRGYGRASYHASMDVRNGIIDKEQAEELIRMYDAERPDALDYFLEITGYSEEDFHKVMASLKLDALKNVNLPITKKTSPQSEPVKPHVIKIIENMNK